MPRNDWCPEGGLLMAEATACCRVSLFAQKQSVLDRFCEKRLRSKHVRVIPRQCLATFGLRDTFFKRAFPEVTSYWLSVDVPRGCGAEIPWVFSYNPNPLRDRRSGYWRVAYTELTACVAAYVLFEVYGTYRLRWTSPAFWVRRRMRRRCPGWLP